MDIDPNIATMLARLTQIGLSSSMAAVYTKVQAIKAQKLTQQSVNELSDMIDTLVSDREELNGIAQTLKAELVAQRITDQEIRYIIDTVIPSLKKLVGQMGEADPAAAKKTADAIEAVETLLSVDMLTVLQLVGFSFKRALGEPLTVLVQKFITTQIPADPMIAAETNRLNAETAAGLLSIAQDEAAAERFKEVMRIWRSPGAS